MNVLAPEQLAADGGVLAVLAIAAPELSRDSQAANT
jgi:hypothetical protein